MSAADNAAYPIGTELRSPHGTRWVKTGPDEWRARSRWGVLDMWSVYRDAEVHGLPIGIVSVIGGA